MTHRHAAWFTLTALLAAVVLTAAPQQTASADRQLAAAIHREQVLGDVKGAIEEYKKLAQGGNRIVAAQALIHLGQCYEKLGAAQAKDARGSYERVVREFGDQTAAATEARARLSALADLPGAKRTTVSVRQLWAGPNVDTTGSPSADGRLLAFTDYQTGDVAIRDLATGEVRRVTKAGDIMRSGDQSLFATFSPDNKQIAFAWLDTRNKVFDTRVISSDGTGLRTLYHDNAGWVMPLAWTADGKHVVVILDLFPAEARRLRQIGLVSVADGSLDVLRSGPPPNKISSSPDSRYLVYDVPQEDGRSDIFLLSIREKRETPLVSHPSNDWAPAWTPDGRGVVFASNRTGSPALWMVEVSEGKVIAPPELVKSDIGAGYGAIGFTRNGALFYGIDTGMVDVYTAPVNLNDCRVLAPPAPVSQQGVGANRAPAWSPDGKSLAYLSTRNQSGGTAIMIRSLETGKEREIPVNANRINRLAWFPDGAALAFIGLDSTGTSIIRLDVESGALSTLVPAGPEAFFLQVHVVPDGRALVYSVLNLKTQGRAIMTRNLQTGEEKTVTSSLSPLGLAPSPDGKQLAVFDNPEKTRQQAIFVMPLAGGESREVRRFEKPGFITGRPSWSPDGRFILFPARPEDKAEIMCVSVDGGEPRTLGISMAGLGDVSVHPDGTRVAFGAGQSKSEVWVIENFLPKARVGK
jgi:Tol biopolymer transport system component